MTTLPTVIRVHVSILNRIVLVPLVAFQLAQVDVSPLLQVFPPVRVGMSSEQDPQVGTIRHVQVLQPEQQ